MAFAPIRRALRALARPLHRLHERVNGPRKALIGSTPTWRFRRKIYRGGSVRSLEDLRGKPVLIRFIGLG